MLNHHFQFTGMTIDIASLNGESDRDALENAIRMIADVLDDFDSNDQLNLQQRAPKLSRWIQGMGQAKD